MQFMSVKNLLILIILQAFFCLLQLFLRLFFELDVVVELIPVTCNSQLIPAKGGFIRYLFWNNFVVLHLVMNLRIETKLI